MWMGLGVIIRRSYIGDIACTMDQGNFCGKQVKDKARNYLQVFTQEDNDGERK